LDMTAFKNHVTILYDACSKFGNLLAKYQKSGFLIEKIRVTVGGHKEDIDKIADAMPVISEDDAGKIILLLINLESTTQFITELLGKANNYTAQQALIKSYIDKLDRDGMAVPMSKDPASNFKSRYYDMLEYLKSCRCRDFIEKIEYLIARYNEQLAKLRDINNFSVYVKNHPGLQHKAGVMSGGTFVILYKGTRDPEKNIADNKVLADFYLPYTICNNCTPVEVTVQEASASQNNLPRAVAEADKTNIYLPDDFTVKLSGQKSTAPDGGAALTYAWTLESGTSGTVITSPSAMNTDVTFTGTGLFVFKLTVTAVNGTTDSDKVFVMVSEIPNKVPVAVASADPGTLLFVPGKKVVSNLDGNSSYDPEGKELTFQWSLLPGTVGAIIRTPKKPDAKVEFTKSGIYFLTLTVTDEKNATAAAYALVNVIAAIPCASLNGIITLFNDLNDPNKKYLEEFISLYPSYKEILAFYKKIQEVQISSKTTDEQLEFFGNNEIFIRLVVWFKKLQEIILQNRDENIRVLALAMLSIHSQLTYYIACIQDEDVNKAKLPVEDSLTALIGIVSKDADYVKNEKDILKTMLNLTIEEKDRVIQRGVESSKELYMKLLSEIINDLSSLNL